jgi:hypothetical protein
MSDQAHVMIFLAGLAAALLVLAIVKLRSGKGLSVAEKAEFLSKRRARMLPLLALIFLSQQASYFTETGGHSSAQAVKITAWLILSIVLLAALATKGFWLERREVRDLVDDENTRANRNEAMRWGFLFSMAAAVGLYVLTLFDNVTAPEAIHIIISLGIAAALCRWAILERRALRDA